MGPSYPLRFALLTSFLLSIGCATAKELRVPPGSFVSGDITSLGSAQVLNRDDYVQSFAISSDLRTVAAARLEAIDYNWSLYSTDTGRRGADGKLVHHEFDPEGIAFYGDNSKILTITNDGMVRLWDVSGGAELWRYKVGPAKKRLYGLTVSDDGRAAFCDQDGNVYVVRPGADAKSSLLATWRAHNGECRGLKFFRDGSGLVSGGWDKTVASWSDTGVPIRRFPVDAYVNDIDMDAKGDRIVAATSREKPELNFEIGKAVLAGTYGRVEKGNGFVVLEHGSARPQFWSGSRGPATDAALSPDGRFVVVGGWDFTVRLIELSTNKTVDTIKTDRHVQMLRFSLDGTRLVVGNWAKPYGGGASLTVYAPVYEKAKTVLPQQRR